MSEGKFIEQVKRELDALDERSVIDAGVPDVLMLIANRVANRHPLQYERFRIGAKLRSAWRWVTFRK